ncbi:aminotransferase class I/II-fold pyridoxal phosphate-dependent enzyme [Candidatus Woesearchaeota archaeon]|jgi:dTDP-4-amino-4,6-dideoxygalactose transaminase|nr:aminotransferase class I/II-fold pyridoxal phosphate-dependent enzyme [Candidatus Woesearchaeota archaeon]MBT7402812.1 aminotransferase class I/II-fold pyridoxal phosphate-dependent enzyme [Candidatus Woesearchaeota archaeon]
MLVPHAKPAVSYNDLFGTFCKDYLNKYIRQNYYWTGSGSAAIYLAIKATRAKKVAVPAFTCSIVKDAIKKSGAKCQFYDTGIVATLADVRKALAKKPDLLILAYNFGLIPDNLNEILKLCKKQKVPVLEDCAQAFSFGQNAQFTIYSTGIAKSLSYYGGFLVSKKQLDIEKLNSLSVKQEFLFFVKALASKSIFNKKIYSFVSNVVLNKIDGNPKAKLYSISKFAKKVVLRQIARFNKMQKIRNRNFELAKDLKYIVKTKSKSNLYLVLKTKNRDNIIKQMRKQNIEILPAKSFTNLAGKKFKKAKIAEKEHLVFSLYRSKKEMEVFVNACRKIKL